MTAPRRAGFTLIELLVVTGLMASFLGLIAVGFRTTAGSQVRQLSQTLSSAILTTQTRALGNDAGAALILDVGGGDLPSFASNRIFFGDVPPFIVGGTAAPAAIFSSGTCGMPPMFSGTLALSASSSPVTLLPTNADAAALAAGYKIRFYCDTPAMPPSPWFQFTPLASATSGTVSLRSAANQTVNNTTWPSPPETGALQFQIARIPTISGAALDTTKRAAVDLSFSGVGNTTSGTSVAGPLAITFDRTGGLDTVMFLGTSPSPTVIVPTAPVYLLIASVADITDPQYNKSLESQNSRWLAINPSTGRVSVGANIVTSGSAPSQADVNNARANARQGVTTGVK